MYDDVDDTSYGAGSSDGEWDDVGMYGPGSDAPGGGGGDAAINGAVLLIASSLIALWLLGAFVFKGSNQS